MELCPILPLQVTQLKCSNVDINLDQVLGEGMYSTTYRAKCDQLPCVAMVIKTTEATEETVVRMEIACQLLSAIKHPNIVQCLGTARKGFTGNPIILLEEMEESLTHYLERHNRGQEVAHYFKVNILRDIILGLAYLHCIDCVHGNLTGNSVFIIGENRAKLSNHWVLKLSSVHPAMLKGRVDPTKVIYMAPEVLSDPPCFTQHSDVYSYGVIMAQVDTLETPNSRESITSRMKPDSPFLMLARHCVERDPSQRPTLQKICDDTEKMKTEGEYVTSRDQQSSRGEYKRLWDCLLTKNSELEKFTSQLQSKTTEADGLKESIIKMEKIILNISRENEKLKKINAEHESFERLLIRNSERTSEYRKELCPFDEPDSSSDAVPSQSYDEVHQIIDCEDVQLELTESQPGHSVMNGWWNNKEITFKRFSSDAVTQSDLEEWRQKVHYEMGILGRLSHPNLVRVYGAVVELGCTGLVLERVQCSLDQVVFRKEQYADSKKKRIVRQISEGLAYLHRNGIVHCNLTTRSVYLMSNRDMAKIGDYGPKIVTAKLKNIAAELVDQVDESYAAPEIHGRPHELSSEVLRKSDVFSLAVVAYEVLTGTKRSTEGIPSLECYDETHYASNPIHSVRGILTMSWEKDPEKRPTADQFSKKWNKNVI